MAPPKKIPYGRQSVSPQDLAAVEAVLGSDFLTTGPSVAEFEDRLCGVTGARHAVACANGTAALHLACLALEIKKGEVGITSPNTFVASANCIEYCGGTADFVDIDETLCISPAGLDSYCRANRAPAVVVAVDFGGVPAGLPAIRELSAKYGFKVIEDAAHSLGSSYRHDGREYQCGGCAHSDLAVLSFHPVKTITTGEGGAVLTNDDRLAQRLRQFRSHGITRDQAAMTAYDGGWYYQMTELGYNYRITDFQCALGISQLDRLPDFKVRRQNIVKAYNGHFGRNPALVIPPWPPDTSPCFHLYPLQFTGGAAVRKSAYEALAAQGIMAQVHYIPVHTQPYYARKYGYRPGQFPRAEAYYSRCLSLPLYPALSDDEVRTVIAAVDSTIP